MKEDLSIGLLGLGTVGSGVWTLLQKNSSILEERTGRRIRVKRVAIRDPSKKRDVTVPAELMTTKPEEIVKDPEIDVVVELMGGLQPTRGLILSALESGKHVVTANKALLAECAEEIFKLAHEKGVTVGYEASVAGGIPILKAIREGFIGNRIQEIYGIINGTANFILSEMSQKGKAFKEVLLEAQRAGYAEQDPSFDIKGIDASQKLAILIALCYGVQPPRSGIYIEGIDQVTPLDIDFAARLGFVIKLLAIAKDHSGQIEARVHPTMIPAHHPLADVNGVFNAIFLKGDAVGQTMFIGRGAGMMPTASAVVSDIAMVALGANLPSSGSVGAVLRKPALLSTEELSTEYYLRFSVVDKPGVLARISRHLGEEDISITNVYQHDRDAGAKVPIVVMTHQALEKNVQRAIAVIDNLDVVLDKTALIRVQRFDE